MWHKKIKKVEVMKQQKNPDTDLPIQRNLVDEREGLTSHWENHGLFHNSCKGK